MPNISNISLNTAEALLPTAYSLQEVTFTNHAGRTFDLRALVTDMSITESIYRPSLLLSLDVKDAVNTLEEFQMTGQEKIVVTLARKPYGTQEEVRISLTFFVTEYPTFGRFGNRLQVYSLRAVSPHAYVSELKKISRAFSGDIRTFVRDVLVRDLGVSEDDIVLSNRSTARVQFIVPNLAPLDAIYWALRRAYDETGSPYYFFQRLDGKVCLLNQSELVEQDAYQEYRDAKFFQHRQSGDNSIKKDYEERARRILSLASDVRMSKYGSIPSGAFASRSLYLDLSTKTISSTDFEYSKEFERMKWIDPNPVISKSFAPEQDELSKFHASRINYVATNSRAFDNGDNYHAPTQSGVLNRAQSYMENLDSIAHDLSLSGDFKLNAGTMISLNFPPAIDPEARLKDSLGKFDVQRDQYFSGKYLVASVIHRFGDKYTVDLKVKRDTLPFELSS